MEKKAKIVRTVFKNEWTGNGNTVYYHDIELDNGDKGSIGSKEKMPSKLNPGSELTYTIDGNKIKAVNSQPSGGFGGGGFAKKVDPKVQIIGFAMSYTKDLIVAGKVPLNELDKYFNHVHSLMSSKL